MNAFRIPERELYEHNKGFLYQYNERIYKLVVCPRVRKPGYELSDGSLERRPKGEAGNEEKLPENVRRAKSKVYELALCNPFTHFCTLTFSPDKVKNRFDLEGCMKAFCKWLNNYNTRKAGGSVRYLLIPEPHKDGAWHLHGLVYGIPESDLRAFQFSDHLPHAIRKELSQGNQVFQWLSYDKKYGFCTLAPIRSREAVCKYITKYITKDLDSSVKSLNAHLYYRSQGLRQKELLFSAAECNLTDPDYEGVYSKIKNATSPEALLCYFSTKGRETIYDAC